MAKQRGGGRKKKMAMVLEKFAVESRPCKRSLAQLRKDAQKRLSTKRFDPTSEEVADQQKDIDIMIAAQYDCMRASD